MSLAEFILAFVGIVIGLGVSDLLISLHRLLRAGRRVRWDWLTPAFALMMLLLTVVFWWWSFRWYSQVTTLTIADILPRLVFLAVTFLIMAAALPDEVPQEGIDLRKFYLDSRVHLWSLVSISLLLNVTLLVADRTSQGVPLFASLPWRAMVSLTLAIAAAVSRRVWLHVLAIAWIFYVTIAANIFDPLTG